MNQRKFYYIKVKEYIKDIFKDGFYDIGYFSELEVFIDDEIKFILNTVSDKNVAKRYKLKAWAQKKIVDLINFTDDLEYYYPYGDNIYRYQFEIVEE